MSFRRSREFPPGGYESWKEFYKAKKEKQAQKTEVVLQRLERQKQQELEERKLEQKPFAKEISNGSTDEVSTLSIALPGSILDNAQSVELRTYLAGQIARAACVFKVDEIVVYDDVGVQDSVTARTVPSVSDDGEVHSARRCCAQLARILQYLECPQYLRKDFFPKSKDLEYAGLLNPLDAPHHMRQQDDCRFREGIVLKIPAKNGSYVNVGLLDKVKVDKILQPGLRVTVEMLKPPFPSSKRLFGRVVSPSVPHQMTGVYWGYSVRLAKSLSAVLTECPYKEGYDVSIGTSERGDPVEKVSLPSYKHSLVVFGGLAGLEGALEADEVLTETNPAFLFDLYLNTCPNQGSRTIRTEEAILITLAELRTKLKPQVSRVSSSEFENVGFENEEKSVIDDDIEERRDVVNSEQLENEIQSIDELNVLKSEKKRRKYQREENDIEQASEDLTGVKLKKMKKKNKHREKVYSPSDDIAVLNSKLENDEIETTDNLWPMSDKPKPKKKKKKYDELENNQLLEMDKPSDVESKKKGKKRDYEELDNDLYNPEDLPSKQKKQKKRDTRVMENNN